MSQIMDVTGDPVVALDWPRPGMNRGMEEMLIGLMACALRPRTEDDWFDIWEDPPSATLIQERFEELAPYFELDGQGPRLLQTFGGLPDQAKKEALSIQFLVMGSSGENTVKKNHDLFDRRGRFDCFSRAAAAAVLIEEQTFGNGVGAGFRAALRGPGPLTTLADPTECPGYEALAYRIYANLPEINPKWLDPKAVFPWLSPTRSSVGDHATYPDDASPLQAFFGMPHEVEIVFEPGNGRRCGLTGEQDEMMAVGFRKRKYGTWYQGWKHPLSPHITSTATEEPVMGESNG